MNIGCVILAAGHGKRFGSNKLLQLFQGKPLVAHAFEKIPTEQFSNITVVTQYAQIMDLATTHGFTAIHNSQPDLGISHSLQLGLSSMDQCDGVLFMVCDQPLLRRETVSALVALFTQRPHFIMALGHDGVRGNPCIFPAAFYSSLMSLSGDKGGSQVIRQHSDALQLMDVDPRELFDVDHPEALAALAETI